MSYTHQVTYAVQTAGGGVSRSVSYTGSLEVSLSESVADSQTDSQINVALDYSACKSFYIVSSQDVTVETNSGSSAADTLNLVAGVPYVWTTDSYDTFLIGTDITALFVTNASGASATIELRALVDATP